MSLEELETGAEPDEEAANAPQCAELKALLAHRAVAHTVIFGGVGQQRQEQAL